MHTLPLNLASDAVLHVVSKNSC